MKAHIDEIAILSRQRRVSRNWRFSLVPFCVLCILLLLLFWEVARMNISTTEWPWRLTFLGVGPTAALCGLFTSLIIAREQYARALRPNLLFSSEHRRSVALDKPAWCVHVANVGPGLAFVDGIWYSLRVDSTISSEEIVDGSLQDVISLLDRCRMQGSQDFHLEHITPGTPLGIVKQPTEGFEFAAFTPEALRFIKYLAFSIRVVDTMGDRYVKALPFLATLPKHVVQIDASHPALELISPKEMLSGEKPEPMEK